MKMNSQRRKAPRWTLPLAGVLLAVAAQGAQAAGFEPVSGGIAPNVLKHCNPNNAPANTNCRVASLPGEDGFALAASRSAPLIINEISVGTLQERVWRSRSDAALYIFGTRVLLNANAWDDSGSAFNVNDLFRRALPGRAVAVAYHLDGAAVALKVAGRTVQGQDEYETPQPERDNSWVAGRVDANGAAAGAAGRRSPWVLVKTRAPQGIELDPFAIRSLNSAAVDLTELFSGGYQPVGLPIDGGE